LYLAKIPKVKGHFELVYAIHSEQLHRFIALSSCF